MQYSSVVYPYQNETRDIWLYLIWDMFYSYFYCTQLFFKMFAGNQLNELFTSAVQYSTEQCSTVPTSQSSQSIPQPKEDTVLERAHGGDTARQQPVPHRQVTWAHCTQFIMFTKSSGILICLEILYFEFLKKNIIPKKWLHKTFKKLAHY